jgi:hypothetical protein
MRMAALFHDRNLFADFMFAAGEVIGNGEVVPRLRQPSFSQLFELVLS